MDWLDRVAFSRMVSLPKENMGNSEHHLHCTIHSIYPAPGASRPHCRLFNNEFRLPNPLIVVAFLLEYVLVFVVVY